MMAATISADSESLHVSFDDQQKINKFACQNARLEDVSEELKAKENEQQALEDAEADLLLSMEQENIPYKIGDAFMFVTMDEAQQMMETKKENLTKDMSLLRSQQESIKQVMSDLKVQLYARFGTNINLEPE